MFAGYAISQLNSHCLNGTNTLSCITVRIICYFTGCTLRNIQHVKSIYKWFLKCRVIRGTALTKKKMYLNNSSERDPRITRQLGYKHTFCQSVVSTIHNNIFIYNIVNHITIVCVCWLKLYKLNYNAQDGKYKISQKITFHIFVKNVTWPSICLLKVPSFFCTL